MLRFHTQTAGVQLTAQQPEVNLIRVSLQALAAVLGGTQSLHTNSFDEALALPSTKAARLADPDPAGHRQRERPDRDRGPVRRLVRDRVDDRRHRGGRGKPDRPHRGMGGAAAAIERGFQKAEIEAAAYQVAREIDEGERIVVGVNKFVADSEEPYQPLRVDPSHRGGAGGPAGPAAARASQRAGGARPFRAQNGRGR
jgi:Methylmalonyl-CoA mutase, N-terminal domain/subunit